MLLSTSGSTGSPKLVRLSRANIEANARSIAAYLDLRPTDRAMTSLPLHYCYGLSVLTSHLVAGASVVLTDLSVADECFWDLARVHWRHRASPACRTRSTSSTRATSPTATCRSLRYVTQAGGRMAPEQVTRYAELGRRQGLGAVRDVRADRGHRPDRLPAAGDGGRAPYVDRRSRCRAVSSGSTRCPSSIDPDVGELVYTGPNVMMGYAEHVDDLARGPETPELRTGDLARQADDGLFEITGRLEPLRQGLRSAGRPRPAGAAARRDRVRRPAWSPIDETSARVRHPASAADAESASRSPGSRRCRLGPSAPIGWRASRGPSAGKCDYAALAHHAAASRNPRRGHDQSTSVRDLYAVALGRTDIADTDTFTSLGGDSLSFVEVSTHLARYLGHLPRDWPHLSIGELDRDDPPPAAVHNPRRDRRDAAGRSPS